MKKETKIFYGSICLNIEEYKDNEEFAKRESFISAMYFYLEYFKEIDNVNKLSTETRITDDFCFEVYCIIEVTGIVD